MVLWERRNRASKESGNFSFHICSKSRAGIAYSLQKIWDVLEYKEWCPGCPLRAPCSLKNFMSSSRTKDFEAKKKKKNHPNFMYLKKNSIHCLKKSHLGWKNKPKPSNSRRRLWNSHSPHQSPPIKPTLFKRSDKRFEEWITANFFLEFSCPENPNARTGNNPWCFTSSLRSALCFHNKLHFPFIIIFQTI